MEKSFAEKLVDDLIDKVEEYSMSSAKPVGPRHAAMVEAREAIIQSLTVPARTEEDDFLTVRDQFAIGAMAMLADPRICPNEFPDGRQKFAAGCYALADAMMAERAKRAAQEGGA